MKIHSLRKASPDELSALDAWARDMLSRAIARHEPDRKATQLLEPQAIIDAVACEWARRTLGERRRRCPVCGGWLDTGQHLRCQ